jgi:signal transduction histidine kinase
MSRFFSRLALIAAIWLTARGAARRDVAHNRGQRLDERPDGSLESEASLLAMVSHDLRTPLTSVKGFAQLLLRDPTASDASRRYAEIILAETNRTIRTIDDVADLARTWDEAEIIQVVPVDLCQAVLRAADGVRHQDPDRRVTIAVPDSLPHVKADPLRVERVMANLITTVLRYSLGTKPIEVGAAGGGESVDFWVRDVGEGIPVDRYAHVFDLESSGSGPERGLNGSGLGLFISKRLVEAEGGSIWVEEDAGRAKGFRFRLATAR